MQAHTTSTTNWQAVFSLNTKLGTGLILLKNKVNSFFMICETPNPSCNEEVNLNTSSMGHMTCVK